MTLKSIQRNYTGNSCASVNQHNSQLNSTTTQNYQRIIYQRPFSYPKKLLVESSNKVDIEPAQLACHRYAWQLSADDLAEKTTVFSKEHPSIKQQVNQIINAINIWILDKNPFPFNGHFLGKCRSNFLKFNH